MMDIIAPRFLGLPPRTVIEKIDEDTVAMVVKRKSRIVMADGHRILANAEKVKEKLPGIRFILKTSAPVCSKTQRYLADQGIKIVMVKEE